MEPLVLITGGMWSTAFTVLGWHAASAVFFVVTAATVYVCREHDAKRHW